MGVALQLESVFLAGVGHLHEVLLGQDRAGGVNDLSSFSEHWDYFFDDLVLDEDEFLEFRV